MTQKVIFTAVVITLSLIFGCKKTELQPSGGGILSQSLSERDGATLDQEDQRRSDFARVFAKSLSDANFRTYLKSKYIQLETLDKEFVYALYRNDVVSGSQTLQQLLLSNADQAFVTQYGSSFFNNVVGMDPLLTIDFEENESTTLDDWTANFIPIVGVGTKSTINFVGQDAGYPGYDNFGNLIRFDESDASTSFTLWVKKSETLVAINPTSNRTFDGQTLESILPGKRGLDGTPEFETCEEMIQEIQEIQEEYGALEPFEWPNWVLVDYNRLVKAYFDICVGDPTGGGGSDPCTEPCERDCVEADEILVKFRISGWNAFKTIQNQPWERRYKFQCTVPVFDASNAPIAQVTVITLTYKKKDLLDCGPSPCIGKWIVLDEKIWQDWKLTELRNMMQYLWFENDDKAVTTSLTAGIIPKFTIDIEGVKFEFSGPTFSIGQSSTTAAFLPLGSSEVFYCDPANSPGTTYSRPLYQMVVKHNN